MWHIAAWLTCASILVLLANEAVRIKYGFMSDRHFVWFWVVWALGLAGMGIAVGLLLSDIL